jgi:hypothetical protein
MNMKLRDSKHKPVHPKLPPPYNAMSGEDLERETARFDREIPDSQVKPLTRAMKAMEAKARRGRPVVGSGSEKINITIERGLLKDADRLARKSGVSRSQLIASGLQAILGRKAV